MQSGAALPLALTLDSSGERTMPGTPDPSQEVEQLQRVVKLSGDGPSFLRCAERVRAPLPFWSVLRPSPGHVITRPKISARANVPSPL